MSAVYTYDGTTYEAACVVDDNLGVETYTVTLTLLSGYTWADGTDGAKTFTFINYLNNVASKSRDDLEPTALYGDSDTVLGYIGKLFADDSSWTVTINGEEYTYTESKLYDADGNAVSSLDAGTYTEERHVNPPERCGQPAAILRQYIPKNTTERRVRFLMPCEL